MYIVFFGCNSVVMAKKNYDTKITENLYENCSDSNSCLTLCAYESIEGDEYDKYKKYGSDLTYFVESERAFIGYHYDNSKWEISALWVENSTSDLSAKVVYTPNLHSFNSTGLIPYSDIRWEDNKKNEWNKYNGYKELDSEFKCPLYYYDDNHKGADFELCFANEKEKCKKSNNIGTKFGKAHSLIYDFSSEFSSVLEETEKQVNDNKFIYLFKYNGLDYDNSISADDNISRNCSYFKKFNNSQSLVVKLNSSFDSFKNNDLNPLLSNIANQKGSRNKSVYNYDKLIEILRNGTDDSGNSVYKKINGKDAFSDLNDIYSKNMGFAVRDVERICGDVNVNPSQVEEGIENYLSDINHKRPIVDTESTFDCDSIFTKELVDLITGAYFVIEIGSIVITIVLTVLDYAKVILNSDQDGMKKSNKKLLTRLIIVVVLFLLPALVNFTLKLFNIEGFNSEHPLCVKIKNK